MPSERHWPFQASPLMPTSRVGAARILIKSTRRPGALHRDPANRMLIVSAPKHSLTLVTRDKSLLRYAKRAT
jgi:PIN domain nuclease of toxin-antitoxin system